MNRALNAYPAPTARELRCRPSLAPGLLGPFCLRPPAGRGRIQPLWPTAPAGSGAVYFLNGVNQTSGAAEVEPESVKGALCAGCGERGSAGRGRGEGGRRRHPAHLHARDQAAGERVGSGEHLRPQPLPSVRSLIFISRLYVWTAGRECTHSLAGLV